ncbi:GNAT family N-acetyltransferase [Novosphingobium album (ex Hu et al. 2023)]|uniref:GNAT family N-acetyltransferase n=1 Tax=Novosphingobium album (ex Hu et al. 2023) TaxID=2930093 RepID=A0ABT0AZ52_9SPHN|nr:GNAT family N-acetyltransferase [Novosphingobium album (ex Hu et al. 2023)]MCJ2178062.1 GNAT family N-acetyltransferase [Novosphingobium album (ex Hu et al. 2023)]
MPVVLTASGFAASPELRAGLTQLNNDHAVELSWADEERLGTMIGEAFLAAHEGMEDALLIAFDQNADYDSPNFLWFRERHARFVYVDRIVTSATARGNGLGRALYAMLFEAARAAGYDRIVCEVNSDPPNPASDAFHAALGFVKVGEALLANGKTVTYLSCPLA